MRNGYNKIIAINGHGLLNRKVRDGNDALIDPNFKFAGRWIKFLCNDRTIFHLKSDRSLEFFPEIRDKHAEFCLLDA